MYYYDVHVQIPRHGYSFGIETEDDLSEEEVIDLARSQGKFEEPGDSEFVDMVDEISESEYVEWFDTDLKDVI